MPKGPVCVIDPTPDFIEAVEKKTKWKIETSELAGSMLHCVDTNDDREFSIPIEEAENYICHPPDHYERIIKWCRREDK